MGPPGSELKITEAGQDFWVLENTGYKEQGYFLDIGAADGITGSNTFVLEKFYKWHGVCVDPNPVFLQSLSNSRNAHVSTLCVYSETGKILPFKFCANEHQFYGWNFRSGLENHLDVIDQEIDKSFAKINVMTVSLNDLLELYSAPVDIDYISIDTEGSEYDIIKTFDFEKYNVKCWTIEHDNGEKKKLIDYLMYTNGYKRITERYTAQESWFVRL